MGWLRRQSHVGPFTSLGAEPSILATPADSSAVMCSGGGRGILTTSKRLPFASVWLSRYCSASTEMACCDTQHHCLGLCRMACTLSSLLS